MENQPSTEAPAAAGTETPQAANESPEIRNDQQRRMLRRSKKERVVAGVSGGLARYLDTDPILFRIAFILLLVPGGIGLLLYIIAWIAMPEFKTEDDEVRDSLGRPVEHRTAGLVVGGVLIAFGALILVEPYVNWFDARIIGGSVLVLIGAIIVMRGMRSD